MMNDPHKQSHPRNNEPGWAEFYVTKENNKAPRSNAFANTTWTRATRTIKSARFRIVAMI